MVNQVLPPLTPRVLVGIRPMRPIVVESVSPLAAMRSMPAPMAERPRPAPALGAIVLQMALVPERDSRLMAAQKAYGAAAALRQTAAATHGLDV